MAKVGEGDPRWIVSDRDDGQNVGQWHWWVVTSRDMSNASTVIYFYGPSRPQAREGHYTKSEKPSEIYYS